MLNPLVPPTVSACDPTRAPGLGPLAGSVLPLETVNEIQTWTKEIQFCWFPSPAPLHSPLPWSDWSEKEKKKE